jgi:hypothetical protein
VIGADPFLTGAIDCGFVRIWERTLLFTALDHQQLLHRPRHLRNWTIAECLFVIPATNEIWLSVCCENGSLCSRKPAVQDLRKVEMGQWSDVDKMAKEMWACGHAGNGNVGMWHNSKGRGKLGLCYPNILASETTTFRHTTARAMERLDLKIVSNPPPLIRWVHS